VRLSSPLIGLIAFALWIAAEIIAFNLVASWTGGGVAFFLFVMKSVLGVVFVKRLVTRKIFETLRRGGGSFHIEGTAATEAWLKGLGGFLLIFPGFVAGLVGLALLTPSVRRWIARRGAARQANPRDIELSAQEWREVAEPGAKRLRRRKIIDPDDAVPPR
jgi:UPF0716 family protein affecting phage T7 exclusion